MKSNKIYSFMASTVLWTKENRITKIEDIEKSPFYEELMFEINANADIEPLIVAKENKFKADDLKIKADEFQKNKDNLKRRIARLEIRLQKLENMEKYVNYVYGAVREIFSSFPKAKKTHLIELFSLYARNGTFSSLEINKIKAKSKSFFENILTSTKRKKANEKLNVFIMYCNEKNIYDEFQTDPSGKSKEIFEAIMKNEPVSVTTYFAELTGQIDKTINDIEVTKKDILQGESSIKLANSGYERDNYVLIDIENEIVRKYAKQMKEKLFPQEVKTEIVKEPLPSLAPKNVEIPQEQPSKLKDMFNQIKISGLKDITQKTTQNISSIKNIFKKKSD